MSAFSPLSTNNHGADTLICKQLHEDSMSSATINDVRSLDSLGQASDAAINLQVQGIIKQGRRDVGGTFIMCQKISQLAMVTLKRHLTSRMPVSQVSAHLGDHSSCDDTLLDQGPAPPDVERGILGGHIVLVVENTRHISHQDQLLSLQGCSDLRIPNGQMRKESRIP